jgi:hypothetical protein
MQIPQGGVINSLKLSGKIKEVSNIFLGLLYKCMLKAVQLLIAYTPNITWERLKLEGTLCIMEMPTTEGVFKDRYSFSRIARHIFLVSSK